VIIFTIQIISAMDPEVKQIFDEVTQIFVQAQSDYEKNKQPKYISLPQAEPQEVNEVYGRAQNLFDRVKGKTIEDLKRLEEQKIKDIRELEAHQDLFPCQWGEKRRCKRNCPVSMDKPLECQTLLNRCMKNKGCGQNVLNKQLFDALIGPDATWRERRCKAASLICAGANPDHRIKMLTPLVIGILHNDMSFVEFLLKNKADPNKRTDAHIGCKIHGMTHDRYSVEKTFLHADYVGNASTPLAWSLFSGRNPELTSMLLQQGAGSRTKDYIAGIRMLEELTRQCSSYKSSEAILKKAQMLVEAGENDFKEALNAFNYWGNDCKPCTSLKSFYKKTMKQQKVVQE
jgi:hypothetical protein